MPVYLIFPLAILASIIYLIVIIYAIIRMQSDYFIQKRTTPSLKESHKGFWVLIKFIKNMIGFALVLTGIVMLIIPGQGLLTILMGLFFMDFPGKRKIERYLVRKPSIHQIINWIRKKANKPKIKIP